MKKGDEENRKRALKLLVITDSQVLLSVLEAVRDELEDRTQAIRNGVPVPRIVVVADEYAGLMVSHGERAEPLLANMLVLGRTAGFILSLLRRGQMKWLCRRPCAAASPDALRSRWLLKRIRA